MRKLIIWMNISLDGYADYRLGIADDELHDFASDFLDNIDILLFGRVTYQLMESYWPIAPKDPNATKSMINFANKINIMSKIVFSKTLELAKWNNSKIVNENIVEEVIKLKNEPGKYLSLGGISICQELMKTGLVDEYMILIHPVIWGKGKRLFNNSIENLKLKLISTKTFRSGVVVLHYKQERK